MDKTAQFNEATFNKESNEAQGYLNGNQNRHQENKDQPFNGDIKAKMAAQ